MPTSLPKPPKGPSDRKNQRPNKRRTAGTDVLKGTQKVARPPAPPRGVQRPRGQRKYGYTENPVPLDSIWLVPNWFVGGNNSADEWPPYRALMLLLGPPDQDNWTYQTRTSVQFGILGTAKPDFLILQEPFMVIRVQSDRYHIAVNSFKAASDMEQRTYLERLGYRVIDIYPQNYQPAVQDNGRRIMRVMRDALNSRQDSNPRELQTSRARG